MKLILQQVLAVFLTLFLAQSSIYAEQLENAIPPAKAFDWVELKSGDWLKGEFKEYHSGSIKFDSDELGLFTIDVEKVKQLLSKGDVTISVEKALSLSTELPFIVETGKLNYRDSKAYITKPDGTTVEVEIEQISSMIGGDEKESNYWTASVFLGLDIFSGNTEQMTATFKANIERRTVATRLITDYLGIATIIEDGNYTANNKRANGSFDIYQTSHFYWRVGFGEYFSDPFQNVDAKYTVGAGVGYDIIYTPKTDWSVTVGPGYQYQRFEEVYANSSKEVESPLLFLESRFDTELTSDIDFILNYKMYYLSEEAGRYTHHAMVSLETELINNLDFDISLFWDRIQEPMAFADGSRPEQNDLKTMIGVGYAY